MIWFVKIHRRNVKDPLEENIGFPQEFLPWLLIKIKKHIQLHKAFYCIEFINQDIFLLIYIKLIDIYLINYILFFNLFDYIKF